MSRFVRATGLSVATISLVAGFAFAGPSRAETEAAPAALRYVDHSAAAPLLSTGIIESVDAGIQQIQVTPAAPVAEHAVATVQPEPIELAEPEEDAAPPRSLSEMVNAHLSAEVPDAETECLAIAVYYESKGEPLSGQLAVAEVVINRARSGRFPASLCGVVKQRGQFSFVRGGRLPAVPRSSSHWKKAVAIAHIAKNDMADSEASRALFFHAKHVSPRWRLTRIAAVGNHIFYR